MKALMEINTWARRCGYFYNAYLEKDFTCNNGYNCRHPEQQETATNEATGEEIGMCYSWSCPLAYEADEEDCAAFGVEYEESEFVVVNIAPEEFNENRMWSYKSLERIHYFILPAEVWKYFQDNKDRLVNRMDIIADNDTDDANIKICVYLDNLEGRPFIEVSDIETVIDSEYLHEETCAEQIINMCKKHLKCEEL